jgi:hypothetical protein
MKIILFAAVLTLLLLGAEADNGYLEYARFKNANGKDKIAFSDDEQTVILYSSDDPIIYFYRSFDMKPAFNSDCSTPPLYL